MGMGMDSLSKMTAFLSIFAKNLYIMLFIIYNVDA